MLFGLLAKFLALDRVIGSLLVSSRFFGEDVLDGENFVEQLELRLGSSPVLLLKPLLGRL